MRRTRVPTKSRWLGADFVGWEGAPNVPEGGGPAPPLLLAGDELGPALLDPAELEDREGGHPRQHERAHDHEAQHAEVQSADRVEEAAPQSKLADHELAQLDRSHEQGDD